MAESVIPRLDDTKAAKIAQSDQWTAISRIATAITAGAVTLILVPAAIWIAKTTYDSSMALTDHTRTIADVQTTVSEIKAQDNQDHDWLVTLKSEIDGPNGVIAQIGLLWHRPAPSGNKQPPP